jgi:hypothetical protein
MASSFFLVLSGEPIVPELEIEAQIGWLPP